MFESPVLTPKQLTYPKVQTSGSQTVPRNNQITMPRSPESESQRMFRIYQEEEQKIMQSKEVQQILNQDW
jgi:hypothetical protein